MSDDLLAELLAKPVGPELAKREPRANDFTREIEQSGNRLTATIRDREGKVNEGTALDYLTEEGLDADEWEATGFRKVKYGRTDEPMESVTFSFKRKGAEAFSLELGIEKLLAEIQDYVPVDVRPTGSHGYLVLLGDMQFGKIDGDGPAGTVRRVIDCLNRAADRLALYRKSFDIGHIHVGWLGDHVEGFVSQNGANAWRTQLTLTEQIRLTRRVMLHALKLFAPLAQRVTMTAIPGNHGETVRFEGKGVTRYDDSHDTESLIAVKDAAELAPEKFGHVQFYVPHTDELVVLNEVAGTVVAQAHGHKHRPEKHFEWWTQQAFNRESPMHMADLLVEGHLHHKETDSDGSRDFIGLPALESESTWFRHQKGSGGAPGLTVAITKDGFTDIVETIR